MIASLIMFNPSMRVPDEVSLSWKAPNNKTHIWLQQDFFLFLFILSGLF